MHDPFVIKQLPFTLSKYYYEMDYGFPNINFCSYNSGSKDLKLKRIKKLYFSKNKDKNWFKLIL